MQNSKGHIAICSTSFYEYDRRIQRTARALIEDGYEISWLSRQKEPASESLPNITHHIIQTDATRGPRFYQEFNREIYKKLLAVNPDIINAIDLDTIIGTYRAAHKLKAELTFDAHEIYYEVPELINKPIKKKIWKLVARRYLPHISNAYTVNQSLKQHYESNYGNAYQVIRNVPELSERIESKYDRKSLVYLGVLNAGRGLEIAVDAMEQLGDYSLHLIGDGDISKELKVRAIGMDNVIFHGYKKPKEIKKLLARMGIGLNMLQAESLNYKLSLANKFFDYMHSGLPSINMDYPEYQSIIHQDQVGLLVEDYSLNTLLKAINKLESPKLYDKLKANTQAASEKYCWAVDKKKLLEFYARFSKSENS